jgi:predicted nucleic acid-binding protein
VVPPGADPEDRIALVDTSVAVAPVVVDRTFHDATVDALDERRLGLAGHAAFEIFSVLTRLPAPARRPPAVVAELLLDNFPETRHLSAERANALVRRLGDAGVAGGSVYDALIGATAVEHDLVLVTRDARALDTYRAVSASIELLST